jgi:hypothetical protein
MTTSHQIETVEIQKIETDLPMSELPGAEDDTDTVFTFDSADAASHLHDGNHGEEGSVTEAVDLALV